LPSQLRRVAVLQALRRFGLLQRFGEHDLGPVRSRALLLALELPGAQIALHARFRFGRGTELRFGQKHIFGDNLWGACLWQACSARYVNS
jgi:hypothetical protein